jgi:hypothetical protein
VPPPYFQEIPIAGRYKKNPPTCVSGFFVAEKQ